MVQISVCPIFHHPRFGEWLKKIEKRAHHLSNQVTAYLIRAMRWLIADMKLTLMKTGKVENLEIKVSLIEIFTSTLFGNSYQNMTQSTLSKKTGFNGEPRGVILFKLSFHCIFLWALVADNHADYSLEVLNSSYEKREWWYDIWW